MHERSVENVQLSAGEIMYGGEDMGFTGDGINVEITDTKVDKTVDQSLSPVGKKLTARAVKVTTNLAEHELNLFKRVIPGSVLTVDTVDPDKMRLDIYADDVDMNAYALPLLIKPVDSESPNDWFTVHKAIPSVQFKFSYVKDKQRFYSVEWEAIPTSTKLLVTFGDTSIELEEEGTP